MVDIYEPGRLHPALQVLTWRPVPSDLVAGFVEYMTELDDFVAFCSTSILTICQCVEILKFYPATWSQVSDQSAYPKQRRQLKGTDSLIGLSQQLGPVLYAPKHVADVDKVERLPWWPWTLCVVDLELHIWRYPDSSSALLSVITREQVTISAE